MPSSNKSWSAACLSRNGIEHELSLNTKILYCITIEGELKLQPTQRRLIAERTSICRLILATNQMRYCPFDVVYRRLRQEVGFGKIPKYE